MKRRCLQSLRFISYRALMNFSDKEKIRLRLPVKSKQSRLKKQKTMTPLQRPSRCRLENLKGQIYQISSLQWYSNLLGSVCFIIIIPLIDKAKRERFAKWREGCCGQVPKDQKGCKECSYFEENGGNNLCILRSKRGCDNVPGKCGWVRN